MWQGKTRIQNRPVIPQTYSSKLINQLMDSDSEGQQQISYNQSIHSKQEQLFYQQKQTSQQQQQRNRNRDSMAVPPLTSVLNKQNYNINNAINSNQNKNKVINRTSLLTKQIRQRKQIKQNKDIRYNCFRVDGNKLVQINHTNPYNSITLQDTSMIKNGDQLLVSQIQKLRQQNKQINRKIKQLQNENKTIKRQLNITKQQLQTKDNYYQQIQIKLNQKQKQLQQQIKKYENLQHKYKQYQCQSIKSKSNSNSNYQQHHPKKRYSQLSQYISNKSKINSNYVSHQSINKQNVNVNNTNTYNNNENNSKRNNQNSQKIYGQICKYIIVRVQQFKGRLVNHKMSKNIQDIIDQFMTQIVNINPITVGRVVNKSRQTCTPNRSYTNLLTQDKSTTTLTSNIFKQSHVFQSVTPPKRIQQSTKSNQLLNLQKSLQKLRDMQKSFITNSPNITGPITNTKYDTNITNNYKDSYNSLDRSNSLIGLDRSNRSKSRRKKIFQ